MPESFEDRDLADAVLQKVVGGWERFVEIYQPRLLKLGEWRLRADRRLRAATQADDLVQAFLLQKVVTRPSVMLGPVASGRRSLWPRLSRSFVNFCNTARSRAGPANLSLSAEQALPARPSPRDPESGGAGGPLRDRLARRTQLFRQALTQSRRGSIPLLHLLLLSERLHLAERIAVTLASADGEVSVDVSVPDLVEEISPWECAEEFQPLPRAKILLGLAWQRLLPHFTVRPYRTDGYAVAQLLSIPRNLWDKWIERARKHVLRTCNLDACRELCPHWPDRLFTRPALQHGQKRNNP